MDQLLGGYRIIEKLGEGGMGEVFKALDTMLEREVAIKLLRREFSNRPDVVERFRTEAVALARLNHPHIATLHSFMHHGEQYFMVLEFVRGETLAKVIARRGAIPWEEATGLVCQALDGLEHAHRLGVVHRDIKPSNLMITHAGDLKLMDFGIARILERARLTRTGHLIGTLEYMSPEQIQGCDTDARADIYSVGAVFYEMVTGHVPFEKNSDYDLIKSQVEELPSPPRNVMPQLPAALESAMLRALAKRPEERFKSAAGFRATLEALLQSAPALRDTSHARSAPPETRLGPLPGGLNAAGTALTTPTIEEASVSAPAGGEHLRQYPGVIVLLALLGLAAALVVLSYRPTVVPVPPPAPRPQGEVPAKAPAVVPELPPPAPASAVQALPAMPPAPVDAPPPAPVATHEDTALVRPADANALHAVPTPEGPAEVLPQQPEGTAKGGAAEQKPQTAAAGPKRKSKSRSTSGWNIRK